MDVPITLTELASGGVGGATGGGVTDFTPWLEDVLPKHQRLTTTVLSLLGNLIAAAKIDVLTIAGRPKTFQSALDKINRKSYEDPPRQMTDLSGIRVITYFDSQVKRIENLIREVFQVDNENSRDQQIALGDDKIGYRSLHFVCKLGEDRTHLPEYSELSDLPFEIQVRTVLQHAWAELAHDRSYKFTAGLPTAIQRKLNLYSGMLEIVDTAFDQISVEIDEYKNKLQSENTDSILDVEIDILSVVNFIERFRVERLPDANFDLAKFGPMGGKQDKIVEELRNFGLRTLSDLNALLTDDFVDRYRVIAERKDVVSPTAFLRLAMLLSDPHKFLRNCKPKWTMSPELREFITAKLGEQVVTALLKDWPVRQVSGSPVKIESVLRPRKRPE